jgi:hypothetical protein
MSKELTELGKWKVGQNILVSGNYGYEAIRPITKITDGRDGTIYAAGLLFDVNGRQRGNDLFTARSYIEIATEADAINIKGKNARKRLSKYDWIKLDPVKAIEIEKILNDNGIETREK